MKCKVFKFVLISFIFSNSILFGEVFHEIQKGETLYSISKIYGTTVQAIQEANGLANNDVKAGQKLRIPENTVLKEKSFAVSNTQNAVKTETVVQKPAEKIISSSTDGTYIVQKGDTWYGISKNLGITVADLQKLNNVDESTALKAGQKIIIPSEKVVENLPNVQVSVKKQKTSEDVSRKTPDLKSNDPHKYSSKKGDTSLIWPVKTSAVTYLSGKVSGVSLSAKKDEAVSAIRAGTVMFSGSYRGFGNVVFIQSKTGHIYAYTGLGNIAVSKGEYINFGSQIGTAGIDTYTEKSQVSLMVFQNGQPIDPAKAPRG